MIWFRGKYLFSHSFPQSKVNLCGTYDVAYGFKYIEKGVGSEQIPKNYQFYMKKVALNKLLQLSQKTT